MRAFCTSLAATVATLVVAPAAQAQAPAPATCLSKDQRRELIATGKVVPLSAARRAVPHSRGELVRARLCESPTGLVYLLTLVARDGKVTRATVDAGSGKLAEVR